MKNKEAIGMYENRIIKYFIYLEHYIRESAGLNSDKISHCVQVINEEYSSLQLTKTNTWVKE